MNVNGSWPDITLPTNLGEGEEKNVCFPFEERQGPSLTKNIGECTQYHLELEKKSKGRKAKIPHTNCQSRINGVACSPQRRRALCKASKTRHKLLQD